MANPTSDFDANVKRLEGTNKSNLDTILEPNMIGGENNTNNLGWQDSAGTTHYYAPVDGVAQYSEITDTELSGTGNRNVGVDSAGKFLIYPITASSSGVIDGYLSQLIEGGHTGYVIKDVDRTYKGLIGDNAIDLIWAPSSSFTARGATGDYSMAVGKNSMSSGNYSFAVGESAIAHGDHSFAAGFKSEAKGDSSVSFAWNNDAEGEKSFAANMGHTGPASVNGAAFGNSHAIGIGAFAEGYGCYANGNYSHAEGYNTTADGGHAEGDSTVSTGIGGHAEGSGTEITGGHYAHVEGQDTIASSSAAHAEGWGTEANGIASHAEGSNTKANESYSHAEGYACIADKSYAHAEGDTTQANSFASHSEGNETIADGSYSHAEGNASHAIGESSHAEGVSTEATGTGSHAEGFQTEVNGNYSHVEGYGSIAEGSYAHAEGNYTFANTYSHSEGHYTRASGAFSHAEGYITQSNGQKSHAEGNATKSNGLFSHAEGNATTADGEASHAEGAGTDAVGVESHAEGRYTIAQGVNSHAEGLSTKALGDYSHAEGKATEVSAEAGHVCGKYNIPNANDIFQVGIGVDAGNKTNAFEITISGVATLPQQNGYIVNDDHVATKKYVDDNAGATGDLIIVKTEAELIAALALDNTPDDKAIFITTDIDITAATPTITGVNRVYGACMTLSASSIALAGAGTIYSYGSCFELSGTPFTTGTATLYIRHLKMTSTPTVAGNITYEEVTGAYVGTPTQSFWDNTGSDIDGLIIVRSETELLAALAKTVTWGGTTASKIIFVASAITITATTIPIEEYCYIYGNEVIFNAGASQAVTTVSNRSVYFLNELVDIRNNLDTITVPFYCQKVEFTGTPTIAGQVSGEQLTGSYAGQVFRSYWNNTAWATIASNTIGLEATDHIKFGSTGHIFLALDSNDSGTDTFEIKTGSAESTVLRVPLASSAASDSPTLPVSTTAGITAAGDKAIITKEYGDANYAGGSVPTYTTLTLIEAATGSDNDLAYCVEVDTVYRYEANETDTVDGTFLLETGDAGDTRWIGVAGQYTRGTIDTYGLYMIDSVPVLKTTGTNNLFVGNAGSGSGVLTGNQNVGIGAGTLNDITAAIRNTGVGFNSLTNITEGNNNVAVGGHALTKTTTGDDNVAIGTFALDDNITASDNTALGIYALTKLTTGGNNIAIGVSSAETSTSGNLTESTNSVFIGGLTRPNDNAETNQIVIGYTADGEGSNTAVLGNDNIIHTYLKGNVNFKPVSTPDTAVEGDIYYDSDTNTHYGRNDTAWVELGGGGGSGVSYWDRVGTTLSPLNVDDELTINNKINISGNILVNYADAITAALDGSLFIGGGGEVAVNYGGGEGRYSTSVGHNALLDVTSGGSNTAVGYDSLANVLTSSNNTAVGANSLATCNYGADNTAIGKDSMKDAASASNNTAVGSLALENITSGGNNVAIGYKAAQASTYNSKNIAIGANALALNVGDNNIAIGTDAVITNTSSLGITAIGFEALKLTTGGSNTAIGYKALTTNSTATANTAVGYEALLDSTTGGQNVALGYQANTNNTEGDKNVAIGNKALYTSLTSTETTAVGCSALYSNTLSYGNTALGYASLYTNTTGSYNVALGHNALHANSEGSSNVAIGKDALEDCTASHNIAVGNSALAQTTTGHRNVALGDGALYANVSGGQSVAIGDGAASGSTVGELVAIGANTLGNNVTGINNTAVGHEALSTSTSSNNTAIGKYALGRLTTGETNTALGRSAGSRFASGGGTGNLTGDNSVFLGYDTKPYANGDTNEIVIGYIAEGKGSNTATLGNDNIVHTYLKGNVNFKPRSTPDTAVEGDVYYDSDDNKLKVYNGSTWDDLN